MFFICCKIKDVRDHRKEDRMESFFLAETTKYLYLLFDTENFMHNQGNEGTVIETPNGQCIIQAGGYIFNTEAHPIDPGALHCCHDIPKLRLFDFKEFRSKKSLFRGEAIEESFESKRTEKEKEFTATNETGNSNAKGTVEKIEEAIEAEDAVVTILEPNGSYVQLEDSDNVSFRINTNGTYEVENPTNQTETTRFLQQILPDSTKRSDPQQMLERIRKEKKYLRNETWQQNYKVLSCKAQPFLQRISIMGELFS